MQGHARGDLEGENGAQGNQNPERLLRLTRLRKDVVANPIE